MGGLTETGALFNLETTMLSVLHKPLENKVDKLRYKRLRVVQSRIKNNPNFQLINIPSWISFAVVFGRLVFFFFHPGSVQATFYSRD